MKKKAAIELIDIALADELRNIGTPYESLGRCQGLSIALSLIRETDAVDELARVANERHLTHQLGKKPIF
jgi:hypothetical protein